MRPEKLELSIWILDSLSSTEISSGIALRYDSGSRCRKGRVQQTVKRAVVVALGPREKKAWCE